ncbi:MAG TPA: divalent-cation tolerance protein CutA [Dehalococcoidia bacterium]|nr:divalent-cation tolerance protein CutA [Dehalococcoidia bacterium]
MAKAGDNSYVVLFITTGADEEAQLISRVLLEQKKAACINIVPEVSSLFWWKGKIDSTHESLLVVKTKASLIGEIVQLVKEVHSRDVPEIIALPIVGGSRDYLDWVGKELEEEE